MVGLTCNCCEQQVYSWSRSPPLVLVSQGLAVGKDQTKGGILLTLKPSYRQISERLQIVVMLMGDTKCSFLGRRIIRCYQTTIHLALKRLRGLGRRLKQDPAILCEYDATIQSQIQQNIVEPVEPLENDLSQVHYGRSR